MDHDLTCALRSGGRCGQGTLMGVRFALRAL